MPGDDPATIFDRKYGGTSTATDPASAFDAKYGNPQEGTLAPAISGAFKSVVDPRYREPVEGPNAGLGPDMGSAYTDFGTAATGAATGLVKAADLIAAPAAQAFEGLKSAYLGRAVTQTAEQEATAPISAMGGEAWKQARDRLVEAHPQAVKAGEFVGEQTGTLLPMLATGAGLKGFIAGAELVGYGQGSKTPVRDAANAALAYMGIKAGSVALGATMKALESILPKLTEEAGASVAKMLLPSAQGAGMAAAPQIQPDGSLKSTMYDAILGNKEDMGHVALSVLLFNLLAKTHPEIPEAMKTAYVRGGEVPPEVKAALDETTKPIRDEFEAARKEGETQRLRAKAEAAPASENTPIAEDPEAAARSDTVLRAVFGSPGKPPVMKASEAFSPERLKAVEGKTPEEAQAILQAMPEVRRPDGSVAGPTMDPVEAIKGGHLDPDVLPLMAEAVKRKVIPVTSGKSDAGVPFVVGRDANGDPVRIDGKASETQAAPASAPVLPNETTPIGKTKRGSDVVQIRDRYYVKSKSGKLSAALPQDVAEAKSSAPNPVAAAKGGPEPTQGPEVPVPTPTTPRLGVGLGGVDVEQLRKAADAAVEGAGVALKSGVEGAKSVAKNIPPVARALADFASSESFPVLKRTSTPDVHHAAIQAASSPVIARAVASKVVTGLKKMLGPDFQKWGQAMVENDLSGIENRPEDAQTFVGPGKTWATEADLRAFLNQPHVKKATEFYEQNRLKIQEPIYRFLSKTGEDVVPVTRGKYLETRSNLMPSTKPVARGGASSSFFGSLRRPHPFAKRAEGTGEYETDPAKFIENSMVRSFQPYFNQRLKAALLEAGDASYKPEVGPDGKFTIKGEPAVRFPEVRAVAPGTGLDLYVKESAALDFQRAIKADRPAVPDAKWKAAVKGGLGKVTEASLAGASDNVRVMQRSMMVPAFRGATGHSTAETISNFLVWPAAPLIRTLRVVGRAFRGMDANAQIELASAGAGREYKGQDEAPFSKSDAFRPLRAISKALGHVADRLDPAARSLMAEWMHAAKKAGLNIDDSPAAIGRNVNQMGRYVRAASGDLQRAFQDWHLQPFFESWRTRLGNASRTAKGSLGIEALDRPTYWKLKALAVSRSLGWLTTIGFINSIMSKRHDPRGDPGVPAFHVQVGTNDDGSPKTFNPLPFTPLDDTFKMLGVQAYMDAKNKGLSDADALMAASRQAASFGIGAVRGPVPTGVSIATTGSLDFGLGRQMVNKPQPQETPFGERIGVALKNTAPELRIYAAALDSAGMLPRWAASMMEMDQPDSPSLGQELLSSLTMFMPSKSMKPEDVASLPSRVDYVRTKEWMQDWQKRIKAAPPEKRAAMMEEFKRQAAEVRGRLGR